MKSRIFLSAAFKGSLVLIVTKASRCLCHTMALPIPRLAPVMMPARPSSVGRDPAIAVAVESTPFIAISVASGALEMFHASRAEARSTVSVQRELSAHQPTESRTGGLVLGNFPTFARPGRSENEGRYSGAVDGPPRAFS